MAHRMWSDSIRCLFSNCVRVFATRVHTDDDAGSVAAAADDDEDVDVN